MAVIPIPMLQDAQGTGLRSNRFQYLSPMQELWQGGDIGNLVDWMQVDTSLRWQKRTNSEGKVLTYCDHYAADFIYQATRKQLISAWVWWTQDAINAIRKGINVKPIYGETVIEHGARGLHSWIKEWGKYYGWNAVSNDTELRRNLSDKYTIGLILTPAHVSVALPDMLQPGIGPPLQTQAGSRNVRLWRQNDWYKNRTDTLRYYLDPSLLHNVRKPGYL